MRPSVEYPLTFFVEAKTFEVNSGALQERLSEIIKHLKSPVTEMDSAYAKEFFPGVAEKFTVGYMKEILTDIPEQIQVSGV